mmetsp:Transcript_3200/g.4286  ORF Transcript_3200/g.4286 Transcript_3200/m.4286 type:complete len:130 (-) Transcript_3200:46-435(-)
MLCLFHNWLLKIDGLDQPWDGVNAVTSEWTNDLGNLEESEVPLAMRRLLSSSQILQFDTTRMGRCNDDLDSDSDVEDNNINIVEQEIHGDVCVVRNLSLNYFQSKLIKHFTNKFKKRKLFGQREGEHDR